MSKKKENYKIVYVDPIIHTKIKIRSAQEKKTIIEYIKDLVDNDFKGDN